MSNGAPRGKRHDTGAWADRRLPQSYHYAIQVRSIILLENIILQRKSNAEFTIRSRRRQLAWRGPGPIYGVRQQFSNQSSNKNAIRSVIGRML